MLTLPIGGEDSFMGVVDLVAMKGITWQGEVRAPAPPRPPWHAWAALLGGPHVLTWGAVVCDLSSTGIPPCLLLARARV